jgi:transcriptional regulator with XRE-family HTH domain
MRTAAGLTREDACDQTGINAATLYRIEAAKVRPQRRTLVALLNLYAVTDAQQRASLIELSQQASQLGWLQAYESALGEGYSAYISFEAEARAVSNYESLFIPGLLQTERYARAVIHGVWPQATAEEVQQRVEVRMQRQALLAKDDPITLWAIVDEAALHRLVGGPEIMAEQLHRLAEATKAPHIVLQVIPFTAGAHPGMPGSFVVMEFPDAADPDLVYIDSMAGDLLLEKEADVRRYTDMFQHLRAQALSPNDTHRTIATAIDALT